MLTHSKESTKSHLFAMFGFVQSTQNSIEEKDPEISQVSKEVKLLKTAPREKSILRDLFEGFNQFTPPNETQNPYQNWYNKINGIMEAFVLYEENNFLVFKLSIPSEKARRFHSIVWYSSIDIKNEVHQFSSGLLECSDDNKVNNRKEECIYENDDFILRNRKANRNSKWELNVYVRTNITYSVACILHPSHQQNIYTESASPAHTNFTNIREYLLYGKNGKKVEYSLIICAEKI